MSKEKRKRTKPKGGSLEVKQRTRRVRAKRVVGIGALVNRPCLGNQEIVMEIDEATIDEDGLLVGAIVSGCPEDES